MKSCLLLLLAAGGMFLNAAEITLASGGKTSYTIVIPATLEPGDQLVIDELRMHLKSVAKTEFPVANESAMPASRRIFLGIAPKGFDTGALADQEHCVKAVGDDLYLFGKGPNGTRYAVYDFLVNVLGFRFFDARDGIRVPDESSLRIPGLDRKRQFSFAIRRTTMYWLFYHPYSTFFLYRSGQNNWVQPVLKQSNIESAPDDLFQLLPNAHSMPMYLPNSDTATRFVWLREAKENLWATHPEYFTRNAAGKRIANHQYCLSNPDLRKLLTERVLEAMKRNPDRNLFDVSGRDTPGRFCHCANCLALEKKYGCLGGPLFDYIIELCNIAAKQYPDKLISTLAYRKDQSQSPPKSATRFPDNFVPIFAPIDDNFAKNLAHPDNIGTYNDLKKWAKMCKNVFVWYYVNPYRLQVTPPFGNVGRFADDIRLMKEAGVTGIICEHIVGTAEMTGFTEMQNYVGLNLMQDVTQDWRKLADEFINFEYGAAAPLVNQYWRELEDIREKDKFWLIWNPTFESYSYLTPEHLMRWTELFDRIEEMVKDDETRFFNVQRLRVNLDMALLLRYQAVKKAYPALAISPEALSKRIEERFKRASKTLNTIYPTRTTDAEKKLDDGLLMATIQAGSDSVPLPKEIFGAFNPDQIYITIPTIYGRSLIKDADAAFGWCIMHNNPEPSLPFNADFHDLVSDKYYRGIGQVTKEQLGPHGKYKFYKMGKVTLTPNCEFKMGKFSWWQFRASSVGAAYMPGSYNNAEVYASLKFQGPAFYSEDAGKPNQVFCDRVVIVRLD